MAVTVGGSKTSTVVEAVQPKSSTTFTVYVPAVSTENTLLVCGPSVVTPSVSVYSFPPFPPEVLIVTVASATQVRATTGVPVIVNASGSSIVMVAVFFLPLAS